MNCMLNIRRADAGRVPILGGSRNMTVVGEESMIIDISGGGRGNQQGLLFAYKWKSIS